RRARERHGHPRGRPARGAPRPPGAGARSAGRSLWVARPESRRLCPWSPRERGERCRATRLVFLPFTGYIGAQARDPHSSMVSFRLGQQTYASTIGLSGRTTGPPTCLIARGGESDQAQRSAYFLKGVQCLPKVVLR